MPDNDLATNSFESKLRLGWPDGLWGTLRVVVAVSGGADSVALLRGMRRLAGEGQGNLYVAHFNHGIRTGSASHDERFVSNLAAALGLDCIVGRTESTFANRSGNGIEAAARAARYEFLLEAAERIGARYVVTGHTADDQAETVLHHILRGTGLSGLAAMSRARLLSPAVTLYRPMLEMRRSDGVAYLSALSQSFCNDETNRDTTFTRNRIRHELIPQLEHDYTPAVVESLIRLGSLAHDAQQVIESAAEDLLGKACPMCNGAEVSINCLTLHQCHRHLVREVFVVLWRKRDWPRQAMGFDEWNRLASIALADPATIVAPVVFPGNIRAKKMGEQLVLARSERSLPRP